MKAYLANSLFSESDRLYNHHLSNVVRNCISDIDLYVPQENDSINDKTSFANSTDIFIADRDKLIESDILIAVIDGIEIDSGVAAEIGLFYSLKRPILALYTDSRLQGTDNKKKQQALIDDPTENQFMYRNLFVVGLIKDTGGKIVHSVPELLRELGKYSII